jgi:hypothetical protein
MLHLSNPTVTTAMAWYRWASDSANLMDDMCMVRRPRKTIGCYPRCGVTHWHGSYSCRVVLDKNGKIGVLYVNQVRCQ